MSGGQTTQPHAIKCLLHGWHRRASTSWTSFHRSHCLEVWCTVMLGTLAREHPAAHNCISLGLTHHLIQEGLATTLGASASGGCGRLPSCIKLWCILQTFAAPPVHSVTRFITFSRISPLLVDTAAASSFAYFSALRPRSTAGTGVLAPRGVIAVWATAWKRCQALMAAQCAAAGRLAVQRPVRCLLTLFLTALVFSTLVSALHLTAARYFVLTLHPSGGLEVCWELSGYTVGIMQGCSKHAPCWSVAGSGAASQQLSIRTGPYPQRATVSSHQVWRAAAGDVRRGRAGGRAAQAQQPVAAGGLP